MKARNAEARVTKILRHHTGLLDQFDRVGLATACSMLGIERCDWKDLSVHLDDFIEAHSERELKEFMHDLTELPSEDW
jgi:hypothetical protein